MAKYCLKYCLNNPSHLLDGVDGYFCSIECAAEYGIKTAETEGLIWDDEVSEWVRIEKGQPESVLTPTSTSPITPEMLEAGSRWLEASRTYSAASERETDMREAADKYVSLASLEASKKHLAFTDMEVAERRMRALVEAAGGTDEDVAAAYEAAYEAAERAREQADEEARRYADFR